MEEGKRWVESEREGVGRLLLAARDLRPGEVKPPSQTLFFFFTFIAGGSGGHGLGGGGLIEDRNSQRVNEVDEYRRQIAAKSR